KLRTSGEAGPAGREEARRRRATIPGTVVFSSRRRMSALFRDRARLRDLEEPQTSAPNARGVRRRYPAGRRAALMVPVARAAIFALAASLTCAPTACARSLA